MLRHGWQVLLRSREDEFTLKMQLLKLQSKGFIKISELATL
jgi:hypothetical protein